jgi:hypothetical protein
MLPNATIPTSPTDSSYGGLCQTIVPIKRLAVGAHDETVHTATLERGKYVLGIVNAAV